MKTTYTFVILLVLTTACLANNLRGQETLEAPKTKRGFVSIPIYKTERSIAKQKEIISFVTRTQNYFLTNEQEESLLNDPEYDREALHGDILLATAKNVGDVHLYNFKNTQYTGKIALGKATNTFDVIFDTGSANIWMNSAQCNAPGCKQHKQYDSSKSDTFKHLGYDLEVQFGTGILSGQINQDDAYLDDIKIPDQEFAEIQKEMGQVFMDSHFDGIVGLAFPEMAAYGFHPLFDNIMKQRVLEDNVISFYYNRQEGSQGSQMTVGGVDKNLYSGDIRYHDVVHEFYWTVLAEDILLGDDSLGLCPLSGCKVVADTGTSLLTGPATPLNKLLNSIEVNDECSNLDELPDIVFKIDGHDYPITAYEYVLTVNAASGEEQPYVHTLGEDCAGAFMPLDVPAPEGPLWILGDIFLSKYYTVFDRDRNAVGFADANLYGKNAYKSTKTNTKKDNIFAKSTFEYEPTVSADSYKIEEPETSKYTYEPEPTTHKKYSFLDDDTDWNI